MNSSQSYGEVQHTGSNSVSCHPAQVNVPHLNPSQADRYSI